MHNGTMLQPGQLIAGKYVVERLLGRGGMGAVHVVAHARTGKRLALKCLLPEFVHNADLVERFLREASATGRIQHRNVVDVFDVGRDGDVLYLVMELLDGKPLSELLADESLTLEEALGILVRAMDGVAAANAHGIVHRDLKPDNIFVCVGPSGRLDDPRVLDFGISKLDGADLLTQSGMAMGTPYYMCIEQLRGQRDIDARADVYALGVILYEAIAGVPPHVAESVSALAIRVLTVTPDDLHVLRPDLPQGLAAVVMTAISREREDRQQSVQALIDAIKPFVPRSAGLLVPEGQGRPLRTPRSASAAALGSGGHDAKQPARATPTRTRPRKLPWVAALSVAFLLLGALLGWLAQGPTHAAVQPQPAATPPPAPTPVVTPMPATAPTAQAAPTAVPPPAAASAPRKVPRHLTREKTAPVTPSAAQQADLPPASSVKSVSGRAGRVSADEF